MADEAGMEEFEAMMEAAAQAEADPWAVDEGDEEDWAAMEEMEREDPGLADGAAMNALMADQMAKTKRFRGGGGPTKRRLFGAEEGQRSQSSAATGAKGLGTSIAAKRLRAAGGIAVAPPASTTAADAQAPPQSQNIRDYLLDDPPEGRSVFCTLPDGTRYFISQPALQLPSTSFADPSKRRREGTGLLGKSIADMRAFIRKEDEQRGVQQEMAKMEAVAHAKSSDKRHHKKKNDGQAGSQLWVDKYAPKSFRQLLSLQETNRNVLKWVLEWDERVFGRRRFGRGKKQAAPSKGGSKFGGSNFGNNGGGKFGGASTFQRRKPWEFDVHAPVLLLSGPPGFGKTTLAHIVAKHAGYKVVEINASDDRSGRAIVDRVHDAMNMQSVFGDNKPNLVVLDEIDGAASGERGLQELVKMIVATAKARRAAVEAARPAAGGEGSGAPVHFRTVSSATGKKKKTKKKRSAQVLNRPLICICNNKYSPALHELRQVAQLVDFKPMTTMRLAARLQRICSLENLHCRTDVLSKLAEMTDNDIRSCLNTLQFLKSQYGSGARITARELLRHSVGHKDQAPKVFDVWQAVFTAEGKRTMKRGTNKLDPDAALSWSARLLNKLYAFGTSDRLLDGVYENFPRVRYIDPTFKHSARCLEWLCFADLCMQRRAQRQQFVFSRFIAPAIVGVHTCCRSDFTTKLQFPRVANKVRYERQQRRSVVSDWLQRRMRFSHLSSFMTIHGKGNGPRTTSAIGALSVHVGVVELLSPFLDIIAPKLRPINMGALTNEQQIMLQELVDLLVCSGTTFVVDPASRSEDSAKYKISPDLEMLVGFNHIVDDGKLPPGLLAKRREEYKREHPMRWILAHIVRQVVASKVNFRKMQIEQRAMSVGEDTSAPDLVSHGVMETPVSTASSDLPEHIRKQLQGPGSSPAALLKAKLKANKKRPSPSTVAALSGATFLSRAKSRRTKRGPKPRQKFAVYFKFQEGFTNAVRRRVTMQELL